MNKTSYEDYKYCMQDVGSVYIGTKYTLQEILDDNSIPFKFQLLVERYILPESDLEDTLETQLYYLSNKSFIVKIYGQLKGRVKINILEDKKSLSGKIKREYVTRMIPVKQLADMSVEEKKQAGVVVQELVISKLALMGF